MLVWLAVRCVVIVSLVVIAIKIALTGPAWLIVAPVAGIALFLAVDSRPKD